MSYEKSSLVLWSYTLVILRTIQPYEERNFLFHKGVIIGEDRIRNKKKNMLVRKNGKKIYRLNSIYSHLYTKKEIH